MKVKRYLALTMATLLGMTLTGCTKNEFIDASNAQEVEKPTSILESYINKPLYRSYEPGEHIFFKRYHPLKKNGNDELQETKMSLIESGSIEVPDGYKILSINPVDEKTYDRYNAYDAIEVLFVNTKYVCVDPVFNEKTNCYDFSDFGLVMTDLVDYGEIAPTK